MGACLPRLAPVAIDHSPTAQKNTGSKHMSSKISGNSITLTRGDTLRVKVTILDNEEEYTPIGGDSVRFALKHKTKTADGGEYLDPEPLILKTIPNDTLILELEPSDTKELAFGAYDYDIELTYEDGTVDTFITKANFKLTEEVH